MATEKTARATWEGDLMSGSGRVSTGSGVLSEEGVSWSARAEDTAGVSPEELIAAAHATCVSMALAHGLAEDGHTPTRLETEATATFDKTEAGFRLTTMKLAVRGEVDGIDEEGFRKAAEGAKENCPVSQALKGNVDITLDAALD
ncbi:MAG: OsmC family protein [Actinobacteria bacterium]|nr:MAG: OsmC family protein [Actinomycetota bacterium]